MDVGRGAGHPALRIGARIPNILWHIEAHRIGRAIEGAPPGARNRMRMHERQNGLVGADHRRRVLEDVHRMREAFRGESDHEA